MSGSDGPLMAYHRKLSTYFGPQDWWPGESRFEILAGAVLAQHTAWTNAAKAIRNLKVFRLLDPRKIHELDLETLEEAIRPSGTFRQKARRLRSVATWLVERYGGSVEEAARADAATLRRELLEIPGIGPETADSILLYALDKPAFVVDTYTYRVLSRHHLVGEETDYEEMQSLLRAGLPEQPKLYGEFHALFVAVGKKFCRSTPKCQGCPLEPFLPG